MHNTARLPVGPLHDAWAPSAHMTKNIGHPGTAQSQVRQVPNTEWQSVRASHAAWGVTVEHDAGAGHVAGQPNPPFVA